MLISTMVFLILLLVTGPTLFILRNTSAGMAEWLHNFWLWGLDPIDIGGAPLVRSWTLLTLHSGLDMLLLQVYS